jgi:uncharacterized protein
MKGTLFHLSFPVSDLETAIAFYTSVLGAKQGRRQEKWADLFLFDCQITVHQAPEEIPPFGKHGVRHFGATLPWEEWQRTAEQLRASGQEFKQPPTIIYSGTPDEQAKFLICDPSGNVIELKAYRNPEVTLGIPSLSSA